MDKMTKILLIVLASGIVLILLGTLLTKGNPRNFIGKAVGTKYERMEYICSSYIDRFELTEHSEHVSVKCGDVEYPTIVYYVRQGHPEDVDISESSSAFDFKRSDRINISFTIGINFEDTTTVVTLPKDYNGEFYVKSSSGGVDVSGIDSDKNVNITGSSGSIRVDDIESADLNVSCSSGSIKINKAECRNANVSNSSGSINIENLKADGDLIVKNTSGSIKATDVKAKGEFSLKNTSGGIRVEDSECSDFKSESNSGSVNAVKVEGKDSFYAKTSSGGVHIDSIKSDKIELKSTSGSIHGSIDGKESDYSIISSTTSGSCNLKDSREGSKSLDASATSGSINIKFN